MIQSKKINRIVAIAVAFALITSIALVVIGNIFKETYDMKTDPEYATKIFGTDIISIEIIADEADWQEMLDNALSEQYIMADVVVNGTKFQSVGVRPKGNSSLSQVASSGSDRYSFRLQFDEYIKDQTCFGLDSFVVNNMIGDNTYMKEYVSYELMREIGVDAPYFGFADIQVNGEAWGLYLAVELYRESYEVRTFGTTSGMLYNVKSMDMGDNNEEGNGLPQDNTHRPENGQAGANFSATTLPERQNGGGQMGMSRGDFGDAMGGRGSNGSSLEYSTNEVSSYSAIFNNVVGEGDDDDFMRVIAAIEALSEGENLESYFDIDQILRYLAAHTIVVNLDSYSSSMAQNYYIYENNGKVTILPWDYNLAWGGFQSESASSVINFPIDSPVSGVEMSSRPLIEKLFSNTEYLEKYHDYLQYLMTNYFADGKWEEKIEQLDTIISDYVKNDSTAFCTFEEYETAVEAFKILGDLRYQSIQGQLDGIVPSTIAEQMANPDQLISDGNLSISSLGSMMSGDNRGGMMNGDNRGGMGDQSTYWRNPQGMGDIDSSQIEYGFPQRFEGEMRNFTENNAMITSDKNDITPSIASLTSDGKSTTESLMIYIGSFALIMLSTFLVTMKRRNY